MKTRLPRFVDCICLKGYSSVFPRRLKKRLLIAVGILAGFQVHGQGTVNFSNIGLNAPVIDALTCTPAVGGTTFSVALYWAPVDPLNPSVQPSPAAFRQQGASTYVGGLVNGTYLSPGLYVGGTVTVPGINPPGGMGWFQVKAWESAYGNYYEGAVASGGQTGVSNIIKLGTTGDPTVTPATSPVRLTGISPILIPVLIGFPPCVPEPSALVLAFCGAAMLLFSAWRHRKN